MCDETKELSFFGLDKGTPRPNCKACLNKKKKMNYKIKKEDEVSNLKKIITKQQEELFLQKNLIKKFIKVVKENGLEVPRITGEDKTYMYQFLYC
jgi:hypothetical protein